MRYEFFELSAFCFGQFLLETAEAQRERMADGSMHHFGKFCFLCRADLAGSDQPYLDIIQTVLYDLVLADVCHLAIAI